MLCVCSPCIWNNTRYHNILAINLARLSLQTCCKYTSESCFIIIHRVKYVQIQSGCVYTHIVCISVVLHGLIGVFVGISSMYLYHIFDWGSGDDITPLSQVMSGYITGWDSKFILPCHLIINGSKWNKLYRIII